MLSKIAIIARAILAVLSTVKEALRLFKKKKREKLVEDIKSDDSNKQLDALDKLRK